MIYTCTTNPSLDYYISLNDLEKGKDHRSDFEIFDAGGKGVNVSIVLNNFRIPSICLGFLGGFTKDYFLSFLSKYPNVQPLFTSINDNTRINLKIMEKEFETGINAKGPHITDEEFMRFKSRISKIYPDDYFILSGNIEEEIKDRMIDVLRELCDDGVRVIVDCDISVLDKCKDLPLFAVKLNNTNIRGNIEEEAKRLLEIGNKYVLYSAPNESSYIFSNEESYVCDNLSDSLINATGTADSMVAGFMYGIIRGADCNESFKYANAASLATCLSNDLGSKEKIEELYNSIEVRKI